MSETVKEAADLLEMLPESEQRFALELIKKLVLAWDPDFIKLTPAECTELKEAEKDIEKNGTIPHESIKWD